MKSHILTCGLSRAARAALEPMLRGCEEKVMSQEELAALVDSPLTSTPAAVICGQELRDPGPLEAAQLLRSQLNDAAIYMVLDTVPDKDRRQFIKNGFSDVFSLGLDLPLLQRAVAESVGLANGVRAYRPARLIDLEPGEKLGFDTAIFLPGNNKFVRLSAAGDPLDEELVGRLKQRGVRALHVPLDQIKEYRQYTASRLQRLTALTDCAAIHEKRVAAVRELIAGVVYDREQEDTIGSGRVIMGQAAEIISTYIRGTPSGTIYDRIAHLSDEGNGGYSHSLNVSTVASLFALGTGLANPEHLALAGLMHDMREPADAVDEDSLEELDPSRLSAEQKRRLHSQPARALELARKRKLILPTQVTQAILDHHERHDGQGYPDRKQGRRICVEGVLLAIADDLDRMTQSVPGQPRRTIADWVEMRRANLAAPAGQREFSPEVLTKVLELFP